MNRRSRGLTVRANIRGMGNVLLDPTRTKGPRKGSLNQQPRIACVRGGQVTHYVTFDRVPAEARQRLGIST